MLKKLTIALLFISLTGCVTTNAMHSSDKSGEYAEKFHPVVGGACLAPNDIEIWKNTKPANEEKNTTNIIKVMGGGSIEYATTLIGMADTNHLIKAISSTISSTKSQPKCGNWCGAGYPNPNENPVAVDPLDNACRAHDLCYRKKGMYDCSCDQELAYNILRGRHLFELSTLEQKIVLFFRSSSCENGCKMISNSEVCSNNIRTFYQP
ncbi:MAG: hypothetical protein ACRBB3_02020 [Alphaproteobacteria bacterium]